VSDSVLLEERRENDSLVLHLMQEIHDDVKALKADVKAQGTALIEHIAEEPKAFTAMVESAFAQAFPSGDPVGHRKVHEANIKAAEGRAEFWKKLLFELSKYGVIGFVGWGLVNLWTAFLHGPGK
jgi:hypothetical protein